MTSPSKETYKIPRDNKAPPNKTITCKTSVQITASMPPSTVYKILIKPMVKIHKFTSIPVTTDKANDGSKRTMPNLPNCRNIYMVLPTNLVGRLNLISKNSYALVKLYLRKKGKKYLIINGETIMMVIIKKKYNQSVAKVLAGMAIKVIALN